MASTLPAPPPPQGPSWDITFTRLAKAARPRIKSCAEDLAARFQGRGLSVDIRTRQTQRGLSTFLSLVGQQGLICIVDLTLVDGMAQGQGPVSALHLRLLDARGGVVDGDLGRGVEGLRIAPATATSFLSADSLAEAASATCRATLALFDLSGQGAPQA
jgi:hypothetical protein